MTHTHKHTKTKTRVQLPFYSNDTTCFFFNIELKASLFNLLNILDCGEQISTFLPSTCRVSSWRQAALPKGKNTKSQLNFTKTRSFYQETKIRNEIMSRQRRKKRQNAINAKPMFNYFGPSACELSYVQKREKEVTFC